MKDPRPGKYQHYKGEYYQVFGVAHDSDTGEEYVMYQGLYDSPEFGPRPLWVRKKDSFLKLATVDGKTVERYRYVGDEDDLSPFP
ncbi:DUF1653 domain-containing protein [Patescibacteria group bacterium]|nr:DUF1653 domain-containing protein [Patescibacteria group bacterium]